MSRSPASMAYRCSTGYGADSRTATMPVVLLTAGVAGKQVEEGFRRGANGYVKKPFTIRELLSAVAELAGSAPAPVPADSVG